MLGVFCLLEITNAHFKEIQLEAWLHKIKNNVAFNSTKLVGRKASNKIKISMPHKMTINFTYDFAQCSFSLDGNRSLAGKPILQFQQRMLNGTITNSGRFSNAQSITKRRTAVLTHCVASFEATAFQRFTKATNQ